MTENPISLDSCRTAAGKLAIELRRRRPANAPSMPEAQDQSGIAELDEAMLTQPARSWIEATKKWRFLLDRYASTPDARDVRIQKLVKRALGDMSRLTKREERRS